MSGQIPLDLGRPNYHDMVLVQAYGGGINTIATTIWLQRNGYRPRAIIMANPGSEDLRTLAYRDGVFAEWLDSVGFPRVTEVTRWDEGRHRHRMERFETLRDECARIKSLPSVAFGFKRCSLKFKRDPQLWYLDRQDWTHAEWNAGRKIARVIGYDAGESHRVRFDFDDPRENARYLPWYPLVDDGLDRDACAELILDEGLPLPVKSACTYCGNLTEEEWREQAKANPVAFADAVQMSRDAAPNISQPEVVGLLRRAPDHIGRQLHVWVDNGMPQWESSCDSEMPCECAT